MKKVLVLLLVIGILMLGAFAAVEELTGYLSVEYSDFPDFSDGDTPDGLGDPTTDGGHGGGGGGIPG